MKKTSKTAGISVSLETLIKLRRHAEMIDLTAHKKVFTSHVGAYASGFRGRGIDFAEVREYQPGDDIRHMDWRVTARTSRAYTKVYREELERQVLFFVDYSPGMLFGTQVSFKSVTAAKLAAMLAWGAAKQGDRVGGLVFTGSNDIEIHSKPREKGVLELLKELSDTSDNALQGVSNTNTPANALRKMRLQIRSGSLVFILSDFRTFDPESWQCIKQLAPQNEIVMVFIYDQLEKEPPPANLYTISDGEKFTVMDTSSKAFCEDYRAQFNKYFNDLKKFSLSCRIPLWSFATHEPIVDKLLLQLKM